MIGIQPILGANLKGLSISGFLLLKAIKLILTKKKLIRTPKTVAFATIEMSTKNTGMIVRIIVINTDNVGILCFGEIFANPSGSALSLAIPYIILEVTINIINTVFAVAKSAIKVIIRPPTGPKTVEITYSYKIKKK